MVFFIAIFAGRKEMNDFTKDELYQLSKAMEARLAFLSASESPLYNKIQSLIENYCEHSESEVDHNYEVEKCKKCGRLFL